jgi:hypothetical protein
MFRQSHKHETSLEHHAWSLHVSSLHMQGDGKAFILLQRRTIAATSGLISCDDGPLLLLFLSGPSTHCRTGLMQCPPHLTSSPGFIFNVRELLMSVACARYGPNTIMPDKSALSALEASTKRLDCLFQIPWHRYVRMVTAGLNQQRLRCRERLHEALQHGQHDNRVECCLLY